MRFSSEREGARLWLLPRSRTRQRSRTEAGFVTRTHRPPAPGQPSARSGSSRPSRARHDGGFPDDQAGFRQSAVRAVVGGARWSDQAQPLSLRGRRRQPGPVSRAGSWRARTRPRRGSKVALAWPSTTASTAAASFSIPGCEQEYRAPLPAGPGTQDHARPNHGQWQASRRRRRAATRAPLGERLRRQSRRPKAAEAASVAAAADFRADLNATSKRSR